MGSFILLVVPIIIIDIVEMLRGAVVPVPVVKTTVLMIYANHCVNVFIYAGFNSDYRKTFKKIVLKGINFVNLVVIILSIFKGQFPVRRNGRKNAL